MKLLMTTDTVGGVWTYAVQLADSLQPYGVEVLLATQGRPLSSDQWQSVESLANVTLFESSYKLEWMNDAWEDVRAAERWLLRIAEQEQPDLIHLNDYSHASAPWERPVLTVAHSCVYSWYRATRGEEPGPEWTSYYRRVAEGLQAADLVVAPTKAMLSTIRATYGPLARCRVIPNGRDLPLRPRAKAPMVLAAGRIWDEAKNIGKLASVAGQIRWPVFVAGDGRHPDGGEMPLDGVNVLGHLSPEVLADWFARASIYVLPARYEPFGLTPLEAAMSGCALVLGDIASLREVWGNAAMFVDADDGPGLAEAVNRLADDAPLRRRMAARAGARARRLTAARMARGYLDVYCQLLENSPAPVHLSTRGRV